MEVDDARRQALGAFDDHQVARHEVAVHEYFWLAERGVDQKFEGTVEFLLFVIVELQAEVAVDEPCREEVEFAAQQGSVVGRQGGGGG